MEYGWPDYRSQDAQRRLSGVQRPSVYAEGLPPDVTLAVLNKGGSLPPSSVSSPERSRISRQRTSTGFPLAMISFSSPRMRCRSAAEQNGRAFDQLRCCGAGERMTELSRYATSIRIFSVAAVTNSLATAHRVGWIATRDSR